MGTVRIWIWFTANWTELQRVLTSQLLGQTLSLAMRGFTTHQHMAGICQFFADKDVSAVDQVLSQELEKIAVKAQWLQRDAGPVALWLRQNGYWETE